MEKASIYKEVEATLCEEEVAAIDALPGVISERTTAPEGQRTLFWSST